MKINEMNLKSSFKKKMTSKKLKSCHDRVDETFLYYFIQIEDILLYSGILNSRHHASFISEKEMLRKKKEKQCQISC